MQLISPRVLVFCPHLGCLQQYAILLNRLEVYHLSLCSSLEEVDIALASGQRFNLFIFDNFAPASADLATLRRLGAEDVIEQFLLVGNLSEAQKLTMLRWAWVQRVPLLPVLERPFGLLQLRQALASLVDYNAASQCGYSRMAISQELQERSSAVGTGRLSGAVSKAG